MDYLEKLDITPAIVTSIGRLDEFKGRWKNLGNLPAEHLAALRWAAKVKSVGASTRVSGEKLADGEIETLLLARGRPLLYSRDEQKAAGCSELMEHVYRSWRDIPLTESHVFQLHKILYKYSPGSERQAGRYKTHPNHVEAYDKDGRSIGVIMVTATPFDTPELMRKLIAWATAALESGEHHPLLVIAVFIVRFLAIHPFQDGNGRFSRALTALLLMRSGYAYFRYGSLDRVIEDNKDDYYLALRRAQATLDNDESQLGTWVTFFLGCVERQQQALEQRIKGERVLAPLAPLSARIMEIVKERGKTTVRDVVSRTSANRNTVKLHVKQLTQAGRLVQKGRGKGTWYERA